MPFTGHRKALAVNLASYRGFSLGDETAAARLARASLFLIFSYVFLANAWLGDDGYITFRVVWNFVHGYGLRFNPDERVQAYTHPLWMLVMTAAHGVTREFFFTATVVSWGLCLTALAVLVRWVGTTATAALLVGWLISSKAFVDYTSSGLEYPLSYLLLALFYVRYLDRPVETPLSRRDLRWFVLVASLGFLNRPDAVLLYVIPLAEMVFRNLRHRTRDTVAAVAAGTAPAVLWLIFALLYYGFLLPNTYYAKLANGIPKLLMSRQGFAYLLNSISHDPITVGTIALAGLCAWRTRGAARRAAASAGLYVAYTVWAGGDFMSGRFFAMPFLVATMSIVPQIAGHASAWTAGALVLYNVLVPLAPIKTTASYNAGWPWRTQNGVKDERGHWFTGTNVLFFSPFRELPDSVFARDGRSFGAAPEKVTIQGSIGLFGLQAGPAKFVIDRNALSDPLLARLPVSPRLYFEFYASHYFRDIPDGYVESVDRDRNLLTDPLLHDYYDRLRNVTRGPLFTVSRFRDIGELNFGRYRQIDRLYEKRRQIALSILANNERFVTDVGERGAGFLRSTGRPGYLQHGPWIPLKAGAYRARWIGVLDAPAAAPIGFVEVWNGQDRIERRPIAAVDNAAQRRLAQIDFEISQPADDIAYCLYVNPNVRVTLERVELYSATAAPIEP